MGSDSELMDALGRRLREDLGPPPDDEARRRSQREAIELQAARRRPRRRWPAVALPLAAGLALVAGAVAIYLARGRETAPASAPSPTVAANPDLGAEGTWIEVPEHDSVFVRLADGSTIDCDGGTVLQVVRSRGDEVTLAVDRGRVLAEVTEHTPARWTVRAGPYEVRVTGTIFSCDWDAVDSSLEVEVERGEVRVVGPGLEDDGTRLAAGQLLRMAGKTRMPPHVAAAPDERRTGDGRGPEETRAEKPPVQEQPPAAAEAPVAPEVEPPRVRPTEPQPGRPDWRALVAAGKYADAMTAAVAEGFDPLVETLGEDDLWALAGAARYARDGRRTVSALETFRRRFAGSSRAGTAAFLLGRTEAELNASPSRAALWFGSYLLDHGSGPLAEEALGRLIDAQLKAGNPAAACEAARSYLEKYPDGVYRELATSALER